MAELNGGEKDRKNTEIPDLPLDIILEIIARLPLKDAIQCSLLNNYFRHWISHPSFVRQHAALSSRATIFHCSASCPVIFTRFRHGTSIPPASVNLSTMTSIIASCNGLLLIRIKRQIKRHLNYYVFNPITCGVMPIDYPFRRRCNVGLAVDLNDSDNQFKLVTAEVELGKGGTVVSFDVVVPSSNRSMVVKSRVQFATQRMFTLTADDGIRPTYAAGSLYWLGNHGTITVAFDVENQMASIIDGPVITKHEGGATWFGSDGRSIWFVHALREEIVIYGHNHQKSEWLVHHRIANISSPSNNDGEYGQPLHFDGGRLWLLLRKAAEDGLVHIYHVLRDKWEKSRNIVWGWTDWRQCYFLFTPTTAKVSDLCLGEQAAALEPYGNVFSKLHQLLKPTAI